MEKHGITLDPERIRDICRRHRIKELFVFGSLLREDFGPHSDVDFFIRLEEGIRPTISKLIDLEDELCSATGRQVDIVLGTEIDAPDANPYRKRHILETMEPVVVR